MAWDLCRWKVYKTGSVLLFTSWTKIRHIPRYDSKTITCVISWSIPLFSLKLRLFGPRCQSSLLSLSLALKRERGVGSNVLSPLLSARMDLRLVFQFHPIEQTPIPFQREKQTKEETGSVKLYFHCYGPRDGWG